MKLNVFTHVFALLLAAAALSACTPTSAPDPTVPVTVRPAVTASPAVATATATALPPSGTAQTFNGVRVTLPTAVASGIEGKVIPAEQEKDAPEFAIHPAYTEITLTGYPAQNEHYQAMIQVLPVAEYQKISQVAGQRVQDLQALLAQKPAAPEKEIPVLPVYNAAQVFRTQVKYVGFTNGAGVRFLTMYSQGLMPVTNTELFYTYQGLTADGAYWVSAMLPINAAFLPADAASAANPPAGDIAFPNPPDGAQVTAYYQAVAAKLNATPGEQLTPSLAALDAVMQSLRVVAP